MKLKSTGRKGIIAGVALIVFSVVGFILGYLEMDVSIAMGLKESVQMFLEGLGILGVRLALTPPWKL